MIYNAKSDISGTTSDFNYRKKFTISHSGALTAYQVKIVVDRTNTTIQPDFRDIRFNTDTGNYIPYWIENVNGALADVWVKADLLNGNTIIYMYYGNTNLTSNSNAGNTFIREISGVVGAWDFNDDALDKSGSGNNGTLYGNTSYSNGLFGKAASFDGNGDYISIPDSNNWAFGTGDFAIHFWINFSNLGVHNAIYEQYIDASNYIMIYRHYNTNLQFVVLSGGATLAGYYYGWTPTVSTWHEVIFGRNGTNIYLYIDGVQQTLTNWATIGTSSIPNLAAPLTIGRTLASPTTAYMNGFISTIRIYNHYLSAAEISDLYGTGGNRLGLVTTSYAGKELVRTYTATEPTYTTSTEQTITAKSMTITPRESPCRVGICIIDVIVTWTNTGESVTFTPSIIVDSTTRSLAPIALPTGDTPIAFVVSGLLVGNHAICPDPN